MVNAARQETGRSDRDRTSHQMGQLIGQACEELGISLGELARRTNLSRPFITQVIKGQSGVSLESLTDIAEALRRPVAFFFPDDSAAMLELLLNDARQLLAQRPAECLHLLDQIEGNEENHLSILSLRGAALIRLARREEATETLRRALKIAESHGNDRQQAEVRGRLANCLFQQHDYAAAAEVIAPALERARATDDQTLIGNIAILSGHIHFARREFAAAEARYETARQAFSSFTDLRSLASAYSGISLVRRQAGDTREALRYSRLAANLCETLDLACDTALELNNLAARYVEAGNLETALETAERAIDQALRCGAQGFDAWPRSTRAGILYRLGRVNEARHEAEDVIARLGDETRRARADASLVLGRIAEDSGDTAKADSLFVSALSAYEAMGDATRVGDVAKSYSRLLETRGDVQGALRYLKIAAGVNFTQEATMS